MHPILEMRRDNLIYTQLVTTEAVPAEHPRDLPAADAEAASAASAAHPANDPGRYARGHAAAATATALAARLAEAPGIDRE